MKRFLIASGAACILGLSVTGIVLIVHAQQRHSAIRQSIASGPADLAREEAAARREGIPLGAQELQQPLPPPGQNAAPLYTKLTKLLHDRPLGLPKYAEGMDAFHSYTPAQVTAVRRSLAARQDIMTLVHEAADKPQCVFIRDWSKGIDLSWPEYHAFLVSAWLLKTESYLLARDGHYQEAVTNQARGFHVAQHAAGDPVLIEYLVGIACESRTLSGMQSILSLAGTSTAVDTYVQKAETDAPSRPSLRYAMAGETGFDCLAYARMHEAEKYGVQEVMRVGGLSQEKTAAKTLVSASERMRVHNLIDAWQADFLDRMRRVVGCCNLPVAQRREVFAALGQQAELSDPAESVSLASYVLLPVFSKIDQNDTRTRAREVVMQAAALVLGTKAKTGVCPDTLLPQFVDPFTSKPLDYRREGANGFVIYSAGPDGTYNGGKPGEKVPAQESVFRYPAIPIPLTADMLK